MTIDKVDKRIIQRKTHNSQNDKLDKRSRKKTLGSQSDNLDKQWQTDDPELRILSSAWSGKKFPAGASGNLSKTCKEVRFEDVQKMCVKELDERFTLILFLSVEFCRHGKTKSLTRPCYQSYHSPAVLAVYENRILHSRISNVLKSRKTRDL